MQTYPPKLKKLLDACNIPVGVLLSLTIQILLIILGNRRKSNSRLWIRFVLWSTYLGADTVAMFALGLISNKLTDLYDEEKNAGCQMDEKTELAAFWAPFLLLHMGGPDTITAYALEDNELWLRQLLGLVSQTVIALNVFLMAFTSSSSVSFLSIPMLLVGVIKCGERIYALQSVSTDQVKDYVFFDEDKVNASSQVSVFTNESERKSNAGYAVAKERCIDVPFPLDLSVIIDNSNSSILEPSKLLIIAYGLLNITKGLLFDSTQTNKSKDILQTVCKNLPCKTAFQLIEMELGLMHDFYFTKSPLYTLWGFSLRLITFLITFLTFILFYFTTFLVHRKRYSMFDISLTIVLIVAASILELYSILLMLSSDWFFLRLSVCNKKKETSILQAIKRCISHNRPRWSNNMSQLSILNLLSNPRPLPCHFLLKFLPLDYMNWEKQWYSFEKQVPDDLKQLIFRYFKSRAEQTSTDQRSLKDINDYFSEEFEWDKSFDFAEDLGKSILFWHTVTEVSYHLCLDKMKNRGDAIVAHCELITDLSRYMLYLLLVQPSVLSVAEIDPMSFQKTLENYRIRLSWLRSEIKVCEAFIGLTEKEATNRNLEKFLEEAFAIAKKIKDNYYETNSLENWNKLGDIWLKLIEYGARNYSKGRMHAQQLRNGGEFFSHVWLLMAHFGLTLHFQVSETSEPIGIIAV